MQFVVSSVCCVTVKWCVSRQEALVHHYPAGRVFIESNLRILGRGHEAQPGLTCFCGLVVTQHCSDVAELFNMI